MQIIINATDCCIVCLANVGRHCRTCHPELHEMLPTDEIYVNRAVS